MKVLALITPHSVAANFAIQCYQFGKQRWGNGLDHFNSIWDANFSLSAFWIKLSPKV